MFDFSTDDYSNKRVQTLSPGSIIIELMVACDSAAASWGGHDLSYDSRSSGGEPYGIHPAEIVGLWHIGHVVLRGVDGILCFAVVGVVAVAVGAGVVS